MGIVDKLVGILLPNQLFNTCDNENYFDYDKILNYYSELLNNSNYYSTCYYEALNCNTELNIKHYERELEKVNRKINELEAKYQWLKKKYNSINCG